MKLNKLDSKKVGVSALHLAAAPRRAEAVRAVALLLDCVDLDL
jgi:hypothetical protein